MSKKAQAYKGYATCNAARRENRKMYWATLQKCALITLVAIVLLKVFLNDEIYLIIGIPPEPDSYWKEFCAFFRNNVLGKLVGPNNDIFFSSLGMLGKSLLWRFRIWLVLWLILTTTLVFLSISNYKNRARKELMDEHVEGPEFVSIKDANSQMIKEGHKERFRLGGLIVTDKTENLHTLVLGQTGTGKTESVFSPAIDADLREQGRKGIVVDSKGDLVSAFLDYKHSVIETIVFSPVDARTIKYTLFNDISDDPDYTRLVNIIIPDDGSQDYKVWGEGAKSIMVGLLRYAYFSNKKTNKDLYRIFAASIKEKLEMLTALKEWGIESAGLLDLMSEKTAASYNSTLIRYIGFLKVMEDGDFSIRKWLDSEEGGYIFIINRYDKKHILKQPVSLFVDIVAAHIISMPEDAKRRISIMIDEFAALYPQDSIIDLITMARSKGACCYIGAQDFGQIKKIYHEKARSILGVGTLVAMRMGDYETSEEIAKSIGRYEYRQAENSLTVGLDDHKDGQTFRKVNREGFLVTPGEIQYLKQHKAFIRHIYGIFKVDMKRKKLFLTEKNRVSPEFVMREDLVLSNIPNPLERDEVVNTSREDSLAEVKIPAVDYNININTQVSHPLILRCGHRA